MLLLDLARDRADGAVAGALGAALALVGDLELEEPHAGAGGALLVAHVGDVLVLEVAQRGEDRVRGRLAEAAERRVLDRVGQVLELDEHLLGALAGADLLEHLEHAAGADAAGRALAAGLVLGEPEVELRHRGHAVLVGEDDHAAGAHHGPDLRERPVVDRRVEVLLGDAAAGRAAGLHRLELASAGDAAADVVDDLAQRGAHRDLDEADVVDLAGEREDLRAGVAGDGLDPVAVLVALGDPVADLAVPGGALAQDDGDRGVGLDVVHVGGAAPVAAADVGGEGRLRRGLAALALHRVDEGRLLAADERAGAELDLDVEAEVRAEDVLAEQAARARLVDRHLEAGDRERILRADVDEALLGADRVGADRHRLDDAGGVALHDRAVHERARVAFVGVADDVLLVGLHARGDLPLEARREARAAAPADARVEHLLHDVHRLHLRERLGEALVALVGDVLLEVLRLDEAAVAQRDALLLGVERHLGVVVDLLLERRLHVEQALDDLVADDVLRDDLRGVLGLDLDVEDVVGHDLHDRALGAEAEAARLDHADVVLEARGLDLGAEVRHELLGVRRVAAGAAAADDVLLLRIDRTGGEAEGELALGGLVGGQQVGLGLDGIHAWASLALISFTTATAFAGVILP